MQRLWTIECRQADIGDRPVWVNHTRYRDLANSALLNQVPDILGPDVSLPIPSPFEVTAPRHWGRQKRRIYVDAAQ